MAHTIVFHIFTCNEIFHIEPSIGKSSPNYSTTCTFYLEGLLVCFWDEFFTEYALGTCWDR